MASKRPFQSFYSVRNKSTNATRFDNRGRSATETSALQRAVRALTVDKYKRVEIYDEQGRLRFIVCPLVDGNPPGSIRIVACSLSTGRSWPVDRPLK